MSLSLLYDQPVLRDTRACYFLSHGVRNSGMQCRDHTAQTLARTDGDLTFVQVSQGTSHATASALSEEGRCTVGDPL
jgi:hypothetical protein